MMTKSDYEKQLEQQNEHLIKKLADAQRKIEYHENKKYDYIVCGLTFIHNTKDPGTSEYYTSNEFWHPVDMLHEHGGLKEFMRIVCDHPNIFEYNLVVHSFHVAYKRNGHVVWDVFFNYHTDDNVWELDALQLRETVYSGRSITKKNKKKYTWDQILSYFKSKEHRYKQDYTKVSHT